MKKHFSFSPKMCIGAGSGRFIRRRRSGTSMRAAWWDYGWKGVYFVTIVAARREPLFGEIREGTMFLSPLGELVQRLWLEIPHHHAARVHLGVFVVMPDHLHGIIEITPTLEMDQTRKTSVLTRSTRFQHIGKNTLSSIVGSFKSAVTKHANRMGMPNGWLPRFYDRIIRSVIHRKRVENYIRLNPQRWGKKRPIYKR